MTAMQPDNPLRIMLVDDEPLARARLRTLLGDCNDPAVHVAAEAPNAEVAAPLLREHPVDVVLLDIRMPGDSGLKLASTLRSLPTALVRTASTTMRPAQTSASNSSLVTTSPAWRSRYCRTSSGLRSSATGLPATRSSNRDSSNSARPNDQQ